MILIPFYAGVGAILLMLLSLYRFASKPDFASFAVSLPGIALWCAMLVIGCSGYWIIRLFSAGTVAKRRTYCVALVANGVATLIMAAGSELLLRGRSVDTPEGMKIGQTILRPLDWAQTVAHHRPILERMSREHPFFQYDPFLGWTLSPNRQSSNGLYRSGPEGLRTPEVGVSFANVRQRLTGLAERPVSRHIALVGDSMTFGHEVACEDSWAHLLERNLAPDAQILNFAVSGYSLSQAFLRYRRDVRPWHPQIVIMGVTSEEILRMVSIYNFLRFPAGVDFPYARPRLIADSTDLHPLNQPLPSPNEIFTQASVRDLPHLEHDWYFHEFDWPRQNAWRILEWFDLFRFLSSIRPVVTFLPPSHSNDALVDLARKVLTAFTEDVRRAGGLPLIVHLPYQHELLSEAEGRPLEPPYGATLLRRTGLSIVEMAPCLIEAKILDGFAPGAHYTAPANAAIAGCLADSLRLMLRDGGDRMRG